MALDKKDIEIIEQIIYKNADDIAVSLARSFERREERMDAGESRLLTRMAELEDMVEGSRQSLTDLIGDVRADVRGLRIDE